jgi:hypothetical protein
MAIAVEKTKFRKTSPLIRMEIAVEKTKSR